MTQAFNLSQFANKLNTSGQTDNTGLQNSSVTVTAGTGMSGGGAVALGSSVTLTNAGVTSIVAGTGISVSGATGAVTVTNTIPTNTAGNGISISAGSVAVACPTHNTVGSYSLMAGRRTTSGGISFTYGTNYAAGSGNNQVGQWTIVDQSGINYQTGYPGGISGTWKWMALTVSTGAGGIDLWYGLGCRVS